jgi:hypothetical protein
MYTNHLVFIIPMELADTTNSNLTIRGVYLRKFIHGEGENAADYVITYK